jgi:hypothetical protein
MNSNEKARVWTRFNRAPLILRAFLIVSVVETFFSLIAIFVRPVTQVVMPLLGGLSVYFFTIQFAVMAIFGQQRKIVYGIPFVLAVQLAFQATQLIAHVANPQTVRLDPSNPYLYYHPYRPLFTFVFPLAWCLLLVSPMMRRWIHESPGPNDQRRQFSTSDLLYLMFVVALCMGMSLPMVGWMREAAARASQMPAAPAMPGR